MASRKQGQGSKWIRPSTRLAIYIRDGLACAYCGSTVEDAATLTLDHVCPCELGGNNDPANLVTACLSCNSTKRALTLRAWFAVLRDRGVDTTAIGAKIRRQTKRDLATYRAQALATIAGRN